jgi:hypothetical protein
MGDTGNNGWAGDVGGIYPEASATSEQLTR